jgi:glutaminase
MNKSVERWRESPILEYLAELHREIGTINAGAVATYIPELAKADPNWFGICVVTANGGTYQVGDSQQTFTIQSISKPFVYGLALEDKGRADVMSKISVEPTGDAFNSISLDPATGRPRNPMINAGAIAATSLIEGKTPQVQLQRMLSMFELYAGRKLEIDEAVYRSESETGHRNRAIGYMLRNFDVLMEDPMPVVERYFKQCSILVTCHDLAVMAATLANRGINPITGRQAIRGEYVESVLGVMGTCGMYNYAGEWFYDVGLPAKSGVSGGIIVVVPGQLGIGVFSPLLDPQGNSVRGIRVCDALSRHWDLHLFNRPGLGRSAIRTKATGADFHSMRVRTPEETRALSACGSAIRLFQLQGNLTFAAAENVVREIVEDPDAPEYLVLDFRRVMIVSESAARLFHATLAKFDEANRDLVFSNLDHLPTLRRCMKAKLGRRFDELFRVFADNDAALEWCENRLLAAHLPQAIGQERVKPGNYEFFHGLTADEVQILTSLLTSRTWKASEVIINIGDQADALYFLASGLVSVVLPVAAGQRKRLATFSAGMAFGEMAVIDHAPRSAMIVADTEVSCDELSVADFEALGTTHPRIKIKLLENIALGLSRKLRKANRQLSVVE